MEIKCPKCRYKFEETIAPGINEKACVCPRCGTPFIFKAETDDNGTHADDSTHTPQGTVQHSSDTWHTQDDVYGAVGDAAQQLQDGDNGNAFLNNGNVSNNGNNSNNGNKQAANTYADLQRQLKTKDQLKDKAQKSATRWRNLRRTIFIIAAILFVVFTLINHFMQKNYSSPEEKDDATTFVETNVDNSKTVEEESKIIDDKDRWIEGSWSTTDPNAEFTFSIRGNQISITDGQDLAVCGTYTIKGDKLTYDDYMFTLDKKHNCIWFDGIKFTESHFY